MKLDLFPPLHKSVTVCVCNTHYIEGLFCGFYTYCTHHLIYWNLEPWWQHEKVAKQGKEYGQSQVVNWSKLTKDPNHSVLKYPKEQF